MSGGTLPFATPWPDADGVGDEILALITELYPLNRSITGEGLRQTLRQLEQLIPLQLVEVPSGTPVFDWTVPPEWRIREAWIEDSNGHRIVDFKRNNLHVVGYSIPVNRRMTLAELRPHLHALPDKPDWIPYRTTYYSRDWGFCLAHRQLESLTEGEYHVVIDSEIAEGSLTYGEYVVPGKDEREILVFAHACHPSLCNDNLSGIAVAAFAARALASNIHHYTYRFVFAPATIGSITWMARNEDKLHRIDGGLVLSVIGDSGPLTYKRSRRGNAKVDLAAEHVLNAFHGSDRIEDFSPWGYDERQFCSPGIDLPMGRLTRTPHGEYPEYHTSADDLSMMDREALVGSLRAVWRIFSILEGDGYYRNTQPKGEPQLGRRGLYRKMGGYQDVAQAQLAMLWVLNQSDGSHSLLDIARRSGLAFDVIRAAADDLVEAELLVRL